MESQKSMLESGMVPESVQRVEWSRTGTYTADTLEVFEQICLIDTDTVDGAFVVTLPPVGEAKGKFYSIILVDAGGAVTVQDQDDSYDWTNITTIDAVADGVLLFSDGMKWWVVVSDIAE